MAERSSRTRRRTRTRRRGRPRRQRFRIRLNAYDHRILDQSVRRILDSVRRSGATVTAVPLPTKKNKWTVIRSPFIDKDSREQFEMRTHRRVIFVSDPNQDTMDALLSLDLPAGVDIEMKS